MAETSVFHPSCLVSDVALVQDRATHVVRLRRTERVAAGCMVALRGVERPCKT
jgi:hypothetical protein